jgi:hypothetical protein
MKGLLSTIISKYSIVDFAKNSTSFNSVKSGLYIWYYPLKLNARNQDSLNEMFSNFYKNEFITFSNQTFLKVEDKRKKMESFQVNTKIENPIQIELTALADNEKVNEKIMDLMLSLSIIGTPLYIGKSTPRDEESTRNLANRIKEHLDGRSDFAKEIFSRDKDIDINNLIVWAIDISDFDRSVFNSYFETNKIDLANFIEIHLINILKPIYNIDYGKK